jgi:signal transduction histidine kinase
MYLRFLAQYQIATALDGLGRPADALDVLLELHRDLQARSDAITTTQYSYYSELVQALVPRLLSQPGLADPPRYIRAFRALGDRNKKHISDRYFLHLLEAELGDMSFRQKRYVPQIRYLSARAEGEPFLIAYRPLPDEQGVFVRGVIAAQIDLARLQEQLSSAMTGLQSDTQSAVAILGSGGGAVIGQDATTGTLMATQDLAPPFDFWQVAVYLHDVPGAMKRFDLRRTAWLWLISLMLVSILFGGYVFIQRVRRQAYLSRAQTTFVSNVTHELRTPLASIKMFAELLELQMDQGGDGRQRFRAHAEQHLRIIREECDRLNRLVDRVLDFSRMERNVKQYRFEAHPVGEVVERAVESFRPHADARGFSLQLTLDPDLPAVRLDADAMSQVLLNLLTNAAQYSKDEKDIRVSVTRQREDVRIEVSDRGIGIEPRNLRRVFEKFYTSWQRMDSPTQGGLGLGLALSREIVRSHGGEITVRSEVGHGSTFTVTLPVPLARPVRTPAAPVSDLQPVERIGGRNA